MKAAYLFVEVLVYKRVQNGGEDASAALIGHVSHGQQVEVTQQAVGNGVAATPRGSHSSHELGVNNLFEGTWRPPLIPTLQERV